VARPSCPPRQIPIRPSSPADGPGAALGSGLHRRAAVPGSAAPVRPSLPHTAPAGRPGCAGRRPRLHPARNGPAGPRPAPGLLRPAVAHPGGAGPAALRAPPLTPRPARPLHLDTPDSSTHPAVDGAADAAPAPAGPVRTPRRVRLDPAPSSACGPVLDARYGLPEPSASRRRTPRHLSARAARRHGPGGCIGCRTAAGPPAHPAGVPPPRPVHLDTPVRIRAHTTAPAARIPVRTSPTPPARATQRLLHPHTRPHRSGTVRAGAVQAAGTPRGPGTPRRVRQGRRRPACRRLHPYGCPRGCRGGQPAWRRYDGAR
jgi:hypothetical protein